MINNNSCRLVLKLPLLLHLFLHALLYTVAFVSIESAASPPGEGDGTGIAAMVRLTTSPTTATLVDAVSVSIAVMSGGTAVGK